MAVSTAAFVLQPLDIIARLVAAIPPPRFHMTRFHGVLSSHSALRSLVGRVRAKVPLFSSETMVLNERKNTRTSTASCVFAR